MRRRILMAIISVQLFVGTPAKADVFGGDVAVLIQILANALQQLAQLRSIVQNGQDSVQLVRDINRGINDSLNLIHTMNPRHLNWDIPFLAWMILGS